MFNCQLTSAEMRTILSKENDSLRYQHFFIIWSLKESFSKAIGLGLGYDLAKVNFVVSYDGVGGADTDRVRGIATVNIEGVKRTDWRFYFFSVDENHIVSVALGPTRDVTSTYRESAWAAPKSDDVANYHHTKHPHHDRIVEIDATSVQYEKVLQFRLPPMYYTNISDMLSSDNVAAWNKFQDGRKGSDVKDAPVVKSSTEATSCAKIFCGCMEATI